MSYEMSNVDASHSNTSAHGASSNGPSNRPGFIYNRYEILGSLQGTKVFLVRDEQTEMRYALKLYRDNERDWREFVAESQLNARLINHPSIVKAVECIPARDIMPVVELEDEILTSYSLIVVPFCEKGTLLDFLMKAIEKQRRLSAGLVQYLARQLVESVVLLHDANSMAHLDLKPDNVVITRDLSLALIDFAHAHHIDSPTNKLSGTREYWAPEVRLA
jgi:serine/threonine protein kinase